MLSTREKAVALNFLRLQLYTRAGRDPRQRARADYYLASAAARLGVSMKCLEEVRREINEMVDATGPESGIVLADGWRRN